MKPTGLSLIFASLLVGCGGPMPLGMPGLAGDGGGATSGAAVDLGPPPATDGGLDDLAEPPADDLARPEPPDMAKPAPPAKKTLPFVWQGEQVYYYCGPSAARMALSARLKTLPSQQELGGYMGTTSNGTDDIGLVRGALDHYLNISSYQETDIPEDLPTQAEQDALEKHLVASIDAGYALVANVVSGWRPPFYPQTGTIYHYIALVGYDLNGDKVLVADPAATGCGDGGCGDPSSGFYKVPKSYWINTSDLGVWITPKGYTWHP